MAKQSKFGDCPYCGVEMVWIDDGKTHVHYEDGELMVAIFTKCPKCGAKSLQIEIY